MGTDAAEDGTGLPSGPQFSSYESFYDMCHHDCALISSPIPSAHGPVRPGHLLVRTHRCHRRVGLVVGADLYGRLDVFWTPWAAVQAAG